MQNGKKYRLRSSTVAIDLIDGKRVAITIPAEAIVKVAATRSNGDRMIDVFWDGRPIVMFAVDLEERGEEVSEHSTEA